MKRYVTRAFFSGLATVAGLLSIAALLTSFHMGTTPDWLNTGVSSSRMIWGSLLFGWMAGYCYSLSKETWQD